MSAHPLYYPTFSGGRKRRGIRGEGRGEAKLPNLHPLNSQPFNLQELTYSLALSLVNARDVGEGVAARTWGPQLSAALLLKIHKRCRVLKIRKLMRRLCNLPAAPWSDLLILINSRETIIKQWKIVVLTSIVCVCYLHFDNGFWCYSTHRKNIGIKSNKNRLYEKKLSHN